MLKKSLEELNFLGFAEKCKSKLTPLRHSRVFPPLGLCSFLLCPSGSPHWQSLWISAGCPLASPAQWGEEQLSLQNVLFLYLVIVNLPLSMLSSNFSKAKLLHFLMTQGPLHKVLSLMPPWTPCPWTCPPSNLSTSKVQLSKLLWSSQLETSLSCFMDSY